MMNVLVCLSLLCVWVVGSHSVVAQDKSLGASELQPSAVEQGTIRSLGFSRPKIIADLNARPMVAGRFDCGEDGSVYAFIDGYAPSTGATPKERLALLSIHPDGGVTSIPWRAVSGFADISLPKSVFVGNGRVYVLVEGSRDPAPAGVRIPYPLVSIFDRDSKLVRTAVLEQGLDPLVVGAFKSGNIVVISEDKLNNRMALDLMTSDGTPIRQLNLGDSDYLMQASKMPASAVTRKYNSILLISMSKLFPFGDHLLLVPLETSGLPVVELSEEGAVRAVVPQIPTGMILDSFISSTPSTLAVRLGAVVETQHPALDTEGNLLSVGTTPSPRITELSLTNGSITRQIDIGSAAVQPACEADGTYRLLTSSGSAGKLAIVPAQVQ